MGIFSKRRDQGRTGPASVVPAAELARLAAVGRTVYGGGGLTDVSGFYLDSFQRLGLPTAEFAERLVADLLTGASSAADEWAYAGALYVAIDFDGPDVATRPGGDALIDRALSFLARQGVGSGQIPAFLLGRWSEVQR